MNRHIALAAAIVAAAVLTGCGSSNALTPASIPNLSGSYTGTIADAQAGSGAATATFAQSGSNVGGTITATVGSATLDAQTTLSISLSGGVSGAMVIDEPNGTQCTFSTTGSYNSSTNVLSGSYTAVTNCTGDTGTYTLTQQCTATPAASDRRSGLSIPLRC